MILILYIIELRNRLLIIFVVVLPVNKEDVECVDVFEGPAEKKAWTMYRFQIVRHATWEYIMEVKRERPLLSFFKVEHGHGEDSAHLSVYATFEEGIEEHRKVKVIHPYNRNEVLLLLQQH